MSKIHSFEVRGVIVWFRLIKLVCNLKFKIFEKNSIIFELQNYFLLLYLTHSKPQKSLQLVLK
jgi:hypothetical protein